MIHFIDDHRDVYGVEPICQVLPIAPSTYYETQLRQTDPVRRPVRQQRDAQVCEAIQQTWDANHCVYGARKVRRQLQRDQWTVARCTVERLMRDMGLHGVTRGRAPQHDTLGPAPDCTRGSCPPGLHGGCAEHKPCARCARAGDP